MFARSGGVWSKEATLVDSAMGAANDQFGYSVAVSGDTAVVGAPAKKIGINNSQGQAYVFVRSGGAWTKEATLVDSAGAAIDFFGVSVSVSGDTAVIGAQNRKIGTNTFQGQAYVFVRSGGVWTQQELLFDSLTGASNDRFGHSVSVSGNTTVVGAFIKNIGSNTNQGQAYVFISTSPNGTPCLLNAQCSSSFCRDGVCCNEDCGGAAADCRSCKGSDTGSSDGACGTVTVTTYACRPSAGPCDVAELCDGSSPGCPNEGFAMTGECRASAGPCDVAESCNGSGAACPTDDFIKTGVCRTSAGPCDVAESCNGSGAACPTDDFAKTGVCRASAGSCDVAESCNGSGAACPEDKFVPKDTQVCRSSAGLCDKPEMCSGAGVDCPSDGLYQSADMHICRVKLPNNDCSLDSYCTGSGLGCQTAVAPANTICRKTIGSVLMCGKCNSAGSCVGAFTTSADGTSCK